MPAQPTEKAQELFVAFRGAIEAERAAQSTYLRLKELSDNEILEQVLEGFYQDEVRHEGELVKRYSQLRREFDIED